MLPHADEHSAMGKPPLAQVTSELGEGMQETWVLGFRV